MSQAYACKALQGEQCLEFATEGERFFDMVGRGIAKQTLNDYINDEKVRTFLATAKFTASGMNIFRLHNPRFYLPTVYINKIPDIK